MLYVCANAVFVVIDVMIASRQECGPRRGTQRGGVKTIVAKTAVGKPLKRGRVNRPAEGLAGTESDFVNEHNDHFGGVVRRFHVETRGCGRLARVNFGDFDDRRLRDWEHGAVDAAGAGRGRRRLFGLLSARN